MMWHGIATPVSRFKEPSVSGFRLFRKRLRITLMGEYSKIHEAPVELQTQSLMYPEYRYMDFLSEKSVKACDHPLGRDVALKPGADVTIASRQLPVLALV